MTAALWVFRDEFSVLYWETEHGTHASLLQTIPQKYNSDQSAFHRLCSFGLESVAEKKSMSGVCKSVRLSVKSVLSACLLRKAPGKKCKGCKDVDRLLHLQQGPGQMNICQMIREKNSRGETYKLYAPSFSLVLTQNHQCWAEFSQKQRKCPLWLHPLEQLCPLQ